MKKTFLKILASAIAVTCLLLAFSRQLESKPIFERVYLFGFYCATAINHNHHQPNPVGFVLGILMVSIVICSVLSCVFYSIKNGTQKSITHGAVEIDGGN